MVLYQGSNIFCGDVKSAVERYSNLLDSHPPPLTG
jgi:hypothetical protein